MSALKHDGLLCLQDIERCLQALEELKAVPVTSQILHKNAEVIATLKKVHPHVCFEPLLASGFLKTQMG